MSSGANTDHNRRFGDFVIAIVCLVALALLVVSLPGIGAVDSADDDTQTAVEADHVDDSDWIGAGGVGSGTESPIGVETGAEDTETPFRNQSDDHLFTVVTAAPTYWRVDGYDLYDGSDSKWIRTGSDTAYSEPIPSVGAETARVTQEVTLEREAAVVPASYQPAQVDGVEMAGATVSPESGVHLAEPMDSGASYSVESYWHQPTPEQLQNAEGTYPLSIEERYTELPSELPERVEDRGEELASDTETPFETVDAVARTLEAEKDYDLNATHEPGEDPVDAFLFEMDGGDSQYFASSMTVLLRSQGIPARYVTGYSVGEPVAEDEYAVRSVNTHAWVEVYFSGHGWITFDPTPVAERLSVEDEAVSREGAMGHMPLTNQDESSLDIAGDRLLEADLESDDVVIGAEESVGDTDEDDNESDEGDIEDGVDDSDGADTGDGNETDDDTDVGSDDESDDTDGEDDDGGGDEADAEDEAEGETGTDDDGAGETETETETENGDQQNGADDGAQSEDDPEAADNESPIAVTLSTDFLEPGESTTLLATQDGQPVSEADISIETETIGQTNETGQLTFTVPETLTGSEAQLTVQRGNVEAQQSVPTGPLEMSVTSRWGVLFPGQTVDIGATVNDAPVEGATVRQDGEVVGTTDEDGTVAARVPMSGETTFAVEHAGQETTESVDGGAPTGWFVAAGLIVVAGVIGSVLRRRWGDDGGASTAGVGVGLQGLLRTVGEIESWLSRQLISLQGVVLRGWSQFISKGIATPKAVLGGLWARRPDSVVMAVVAVIRSVLGALRRIVQFKTVEGTTEPETTGNPTSETDNSSIATGERSSLSIRQAWGTFVRLVFRRVDPTQTPMELARKATAVGLPNDPVVRLTESFRVVEYGRADPDSHVEEANTALTDIQTTREAVATDNRQERAEKDDVNASE